MGGKGPSGPQSANEPIVAMQNLQAQQAQNANMQRNARLNYGKNLITGMFEGTPSGASLLDLSSIANASPYTGTAPLVNTPYGSAGDPNAGLEAQWASTHGGGALDPSLFTSSAAAGKYGGKLANGYSWGVLGNTGGQTAYGIYDPSGQLVDSANSLSDLASSKIYVGGDPNNLQGGFQPSFYDQYRNSILNYYDPQESNQYAQARSDLSASLARAGQLQSSTASTDIANLARQDALNRAQIASQADTQTGALRSTIQGDEESALNQLYSTEDPSVAANTAGNMVANAQLTKPLLNPAGALFSTINVGVGNALTGFLNPTAYLNPGATGMGMATTPSGAQSTGLASSG